ncbi:MAG TPA: SPOR domain-containing protein [Blastocatellia bacterium]|jgi:cell division septation protein DedD|nr:SPOR domain-containing protein [Blastocatellia bacterium]
MSNKQVTAIFIGGIALLLGAFWAGLKVVKQNSAADVNQTSARNAQGGVSPAPQSQGSQSPSGEASSGDARYIVRVAAFGTLEQADQLAIELRRKYISAHTQPPSGDDTLFRVNIGPYNRREDAQQVANQLAGEGRKGVMIISGPQN